MPTSLLIALATSPSKALLVLGILIGGAAIPHAQEKPRLIPSQQDPAFCPAPEPTEPTQPGR